MPDKDDSGLGSGKSKPERLNQSRRTRVRTRAFTQRKPSPQENARSTGLITVTRRKEDSSIVPFSNDATLTANAGTAGALVERTKRVDLRKAERYSDLVPKPFIWQDASF
jgi:hypothetical protein